MSGRGGKKGGMRPSTDAVAGARVDKDEKKKLTGALTAPPRQVELFFHDLQAYGEGQALVDGVQVARLWIDGELVLDADRYGCVLYKSIREAPPLDSAQTGLVDKFVADTKTYESEKTKYEADLKIYLADKKAFDAEKALIRKKPDTPATLREPAKPTQPKPPEKTKEIISAFKAKAAWDQFIAQVKAGLELPDGASDQTFMELLKSAVLKAGLTGTCDWNDQAFRKRLEGYLKKKVARYGKRSAAGGVTLPLPDADKGESVTIKLELAGLKFTEPVKDLAELKLDLGYAQRSAIYYPQGSAGSSDPDWCLNRQQVSAWKARCNVTGAEKPIYNWFEIQHKWEAEPKDEPPFQRRMLVMQWCQPVFYRRLARHLSGPIAPLELPPSNSDPAAGRPTIKAPVIDGVPTMMVSTSDTYPHAKYYGRFGRKGRLQPCHHERDLVRSNGFYRYPKPVPVTPREQVLEQPADAPGQPASVRTFERKLIPASGKTRASLKWVEIAPADPKFPAPGALKDLEARGGKEGEKLTVQIYETGTRNLVEALKQLYLGSGGDALLKKKGSSRVHDQHRRMIIREIEEAELLKPEAEQKASCWRAVQYKDGKGGVMKGEQDPDYTISHPDRDSASDDVAYRWHMGIDVATTSGEPIFAIHGGMARWREDKEIGGVVDVQHPAGTTSYLHSQLTGAYWAAGVARHPGGKSVPPSTPVKAGDIVGLAGRSGGTHANPSATHAHMQGAGITLGPKAFPDSHRRLLPSEHLIEELYCQAETGDGENGGAPVHGVRIVSRCFGRAPSPNATLPRFRPKSPVTPEDWLFTDGSFTCWAFNEKRCPVQTQVEAERDRRLAAAAAAAAAEAAQRRRAAPAPAARRR